MKSKEGMQYKCNTNIARKEKGSFKMKRLFNLLVKQFHLFDPFIC